MSTRITRKDLEQALRAYCAALSAPYGHYLKVEPGESVPADVPPDALLSELADGSKVYVLTGGLALDGAYGGWQVQRIIGTDPAYRRGDDGPCTGVTTLFGGGYRPAREIYLMLTAATEAVRQYEEK